MPLVFMQMKSFYLCFISLLVAGCSSGPYHLTSVFNEEKIPAAPDYSLIESWAAHPAKKDASDSVPLKSGVRNEQSLARADVFFIYPTIFTKKPEGQYEWNADARDIKLNDGIQRSTILNQGSIFNGSARVYSPYYRQAHYHAFVTSDRETAGKAFAVAYSDIRNAFIYYLENFNQDRPVIIASHSQGSLHAERLLKEFFDGKPLQKKLVAAYLVGRAVPKNAFENIPPSNAPEQVGAWSSWCTFSRDFYPASYQTWYRGALTTNPLTWNSDPGFVPKEKNLGGVGFKFTMVPKFADAQSLDGILWINKPYVTGRFWVRVKNWHRADMNLFWMNIRENAAVRTKAYFDRQTSLGG